MKNTRNSPWMTLINCTVNNLKLLTYFYTLSVLFQHLHWGMKVYFHIFDIKFKPIYDQQSTFNG